jgi:SWIM zinc finger
MLYSSSQQSSASAGTLERHKTVRLRSFKGDDWYNISIDQKTCDCPKFDRKADGCEHLTALGIHRLRPFTPTTHPTFSQALSGLVKSLRIRRVGDAVYWLMYLDSFKGAQYRFRTARRLLIGSAEDGHSVAIMEKVGKLFWKLSKPQSELIDLAAEAIRICKLPNWWHPDSGGPDYIHQSLFGQRAWWYKAWDHNLTTLQNEIEKAIAEKNRAMALGAVMAFADAQQAFGATKQAEFLLQQAVRIGHDLAARLCNVHLSAKSALSGDNNFLSQAVWMMAGGESPVAEKILPVTADECHELLAKAKQRWQNPELFPAGAVTAFTALEMIPGSWDASQRCGRCAEHSSTIYG